MNNGVYNGTRILTKETVELMHTPQPGNPISGILWYGLAWYHETIFGMDVSGHAGDISGADTWMLFNETEDIGVIYFANGNPGFSLLPFQGLLTVQLILYSLFTKEGTFNGEMQHNFAVSSDPFVFTPFKQILEAHLKQ
jgi:CubicO group peptidase (beta-lactamase class C family)